jgi:hypothetical protein
MEKRLENAEFLRLSIDRPDYESRLEWTCANIHLGAEEALWEHLMNFLFANLSRKWRFNLTV